MSGRTRVLKGSSLSSRSVSLCTSPDFPLTVTWEFLQKSLRDEVVSFLFPRGWCAGHMDVSILRFLGLRPHDVLQGRVVVLRRSTSLPVPNPPDSHPRPPLVTELCDDGVDRESRSPSVWWMGSFSVEDLLNYYPFLVCTIRLI